MTAEDKQGEDQGSSENEETDYRSMDRAELEAAAIAAIRQHRDLLESDQEIYREWQRASSDPSTPGAVLKLLQDEYLSRQRKSAAQKDQLSEIIEILGFIPPLPDGAD